MSISQIEPLRWPTLEQHKLTFPLSHLRSNPPDTFRAQFREFLTCFHWRRRRKGGLAQAQSRNSKPPATPDCFGPAGGVPSNWRSLSNYCGNQQNSNPNHSLQSCSAGRLGSRATGLTGTTRSYSINNNNRNSKNKNKPPTETQNNNNDNNNSPPSATNMPTLATEIVELEP